MATPKEIPFDELLAALKDADTPLNPRFLYRLSDLDPKDLESLERVWPEVPDWRRRALLEDVEVLGESDNLLSFLGLARFALQDADPAVRLPAVRTLWVEEEKHLIPLFLGLLQKDPNDEVRTAAAAGLGRYVYLGELEEIPAQTLQQIEEALIQVARNEAEKSFLRRAALESLGFSSRKEVAGEIEKAFGSDSRDWVSSALIAMGRSANERWQPQVIAMLDSPHPQLRRPAAQAAGELEIHTAVPRLIELLDDTDDETRSNSIWSLSQLGGSGVRELLEKLVEEADDEDLEFLEDALDNLSFTEDMQLMPLFDFAEAAKKVHIEDDLPLADDLDIPDFLGADEEDDDDEDEGDDEYDEEDDL